MPSGLLNLEEEYIADVMGDARRYADDRPSDQAGYLFEGMNKKQLAQTIRDLEKKMRAAAKVLDFEVAAQWRDQLLVCKEALFGMKEA